jgi:gamma-glutamylaminecyclotransferase
LKGIAPNFVEWPPELWPEKKEEKVNNNGGLVPTKVFVYGTLKKGFGNHPILSNAKFLGEAHTMEASFQMYSLGGFPAVTLEGNQRIIGEVYEVEDPSIISNMDELEHHPHWYQRIMVPTSLGAAWTYIMPFSRLKKPIPPKVMEGFWSRDRR